MNTDKIIETISYWATAYSVKILAAILVLLIGKWLAGKISKLITKILKKIKNCCLICFSLEAPQFASNRRLF